MFTRIVLQIYKLLKEHKSSISWISTKGKI